MPLLRCVVLVASIMAVAPPAAAEVWVVVAGGGTTPTGGAEAMKTFGDARPGFPKVGLARGMPRLVQSEREREQARQQEASVRAAALSEAPSAGPAAAAYAHAHHTVDFIEIGVVDLGAAKRFYGEAFGWQMVDHGPESVCVVIDGHERYGLSKVHQVNRGGVWLVLFSDDLDQTAAAVLRAGGTITKEPAPTPDGRQFHFADPSGNEMAVWSTS